VPLAALLLADPVPGARGPRRLVPGRTLSSPTSDPVEGARAGKVPIWAIRDPRDPRAVSLLRGLAPAWIAVACFPWRLGTDWRNGSPLGAVNIHPSLLPAYRGPAPLFWQLRAGERRTGVTLHRLDAGLDTGPIVRRRAVPLPDGIDTDGAESLLAGAGARLLADALRGAGLRGRPQPVRGRSRQGWPSGPDRVVSRRWSARRAYNFIRGAARWGPFVVDAPRGERLTVADAVGFWNDPPPRPRAGERRMRFRGGVLGVLPEPGSAA
jgi:methionyl-tRNA formyltransferase